MTFTRAEFEALRSKVEPIRSVYDVDRLLVERPDEYDRLLGWYNRVLSSNGKPTGIVSKRLSLYRPEPVNWLWGQRIPLGKITVLAGDGGEGKSFATLGIAAAITTGRCLPGGSLEKPSSVLMWNGEDGPSDTIHERATGAGADLTRIIMLEEVTEHGRRVPFGLQHLGLLAQQLEQEPDIAMVVIDPITALLPGIDSHRDSDIRTALQPLATMAEKASVAVLLVMHLNKGEHISALHRLSGSIAFGALARSVLFLGTHAISGRKAIDTLKHNLARGKPDPVEFALTEEGFRWVGTAPELTEGAIRASQIRANKGSQGEGAEEFLRSYLAEKPMNSTMVYAEAKTRGISDMTLKRAKERLGVKATKHGIGEGAMWKWNLPDLEPPPTTSEEPLRTGSVNEIEEEQKTQSVEPVFRDDDEVDLLELYK